MGPPQLYANASSIRGNAQLFDIVAGMGTDVKLKSYSDIMMAKCTKIDSPTAIYLYEDNTAQSPSTSYGKQRRKSRIFMEYDIWQQISECRYCNIR
jgi:hypothetical protein